MKLFIDGDAFPNLLKPIIIKAITRLKLETIVISNKRITIGKNSSIEYIIVKQGANEADNRIVELVQAEDLVITADIPLADRVISKKGHAIDHRGELYSVSNIKQYLTMRNFMESMREAGEITGGPKAFGPKDAHAFANQFNAFLNKRYK